ncbi:acyl-CoA N-acyltransferase [Trametes maxima]|nr:acyl-CoA N-acyltransferase [Trametes maxima]
MTSADITTPTPSYEVLPLASPLSDADIKRYREIRLTSLRTDPDHFLSTYDQEERYTEETWRRLLDGEGKAAFVVRTASGVGDGRDTQKRGDNQADEGESFVGSIVVVAGRVLTGVPIPAAANKDRDYFLVALWVSPEHRRKGLARRLVDTSLSWAAEDARRHDATMGSFVRAPAEVFLLVAISNTVAQGMYKGMDFETVGVEELEWRGEGVWMKRRLEN